MTVSADIAHGAAMRIGMAIVTRARGIAAICAARGAGQAKLGAASSIHRSVCICGEVSVTVQTRKSLVFAAQREASRAVVELRFGKSGRSVTT